MGVKLKGGRLPGETAKAHHAFLTYRDMPAKDRSVLEAWRIHRGTDGARERRSPPGYWSRWSTVNNWAQRAQSWDAHRAMVYKEAFESEVEGMAKRHARIAFKALCLVERAIDEYLGEGGEVDVTVSELTKLMAVASKLEQLSNDKPTDLEKRVLVYTPRPPIGEDDSE